MHERTHPFSEGTVGFVLLRNNRVSVLLLEFDKLIETVVPSRSLTDLPDETQLVQHGPCV